MVQSREVMSYSGVRQRFEVIKTLTRVMQGFDNISPALSSLIEVFREFSESYFQYFEADKDTDLFSLSRALERIQLEWANISRACEQRQIREFSQYLCDTKGVGYTPADRQAFAYYKCFKGYKPAPVPIVYFEKLYAVTRYPFTPFALISIPFQFYNQPTEWQALAHELGHQIYWNSAPLTKFASLHSNLKNAVIKRLVGQETGDYDQFMKERLLVNLWIRWLEEAVADIGGVLLAGPSYFHTTLERTREADTLITHDADHPPAYIRPLICLEAMKWKFRSLGLPDSTGPLVELYAPMRAEGDKMKLPPENLKMGELSELTPEIVDAILSCEWIDADDEPAPLGSLFVVDHWMNDLSQVGSRAPEFTGRVPPPPPPSPDSFAQLYDYLKAKIKKGQGLREGNKLDSEVRKAMLSLDLGPERQFYSGSGQYTVAYYTTTPTNIDLYTVTQ